MLKEDKITFIYDLRESINRVIFWFAGLFLLLLGTGYLAILATSFFSGEFKYVDLLSEQTFGILLLFVTSIYGFIPFTNSLGAVSYLEEGLRIRAYFSFRRWIWIPWEKVIRMEEVYEGTRTTTLIFVESATIWHLIMGVMYTGKRQHVIALKTGLQERKRLEQLIKEKLSINDQSVLD